MTSGVYVLSCRLTSGPLWLGIYPFLWWFLLVIFVLFLLHWRYELPCQDKLPEFHCTPILGCIRVLRLVFHPLGLRLDKALCGWNSVTHVEVVLACLVVDSLSYCKFIFASNFCLIVDLCFHPSRALTRSFEASTPSTWMYFCYFHIHSHSKTGSFNSKLVDCFIAIQILSCCIHFPVEISPL